MPARYRYAHHADFVRLDALIETGGLYADIDTLFVRPFPPELFGAKFVIGREDDVRDELTGAVRPSLCNALLLSEPRSLFAVMWRRTAAGALNGTWSNHSTLLPHELSETAARTPCGSSRAARSTSTAPTARTSRGCSSSSRTSPAGVYSIHLWAHLWWSEERRDFSTDARRAARRGLRSASVDTTYNVLARAVPPGARRAVRVHYLALHEPRGTRSRRSAACVRCARAGAELRWIPFVPGTWLGPGLPARLRGRDRRSRARTTCSSGPSAATSSSRTSCPSTGRSCARSIRACRSSATRCGRPTGCPRTGRPCSTTPTSSWCRPQWNRELLERSGVRRPVRVAPHVAAAPRARDERVVERHPERVVRRLQHRSVDGSQGARRRRCAPTSRRSRAATTPCSSSRPRQRDFTDGRSGGAGPVAPGSTRVDARRAARRDRAPGARCGSSPPSSTIATSTPCTRAATAISRSARSEGWGLPPFDAAAAGNPVVITGYGGHCEYLDDSERVPRRLRARRGRRSRRRRLVHPGPALGGGVDRARRGAAARGRRRARRGAAPADSAPVRACSREFAGPVVAGAFLAALARVAARWLNRAPDSSIASTSACTSAGVGPPRDDRDALAHAVRELGAGEEHVAGRHDIGLDAAVQVVELRAVRPALGPVAEADRVRRRGRGRLEPRRAPRPCGPAPARARSSARRGRPCRRGRGT